MIRDLINLATMKAVSYDPEAMELIIEFPGRVTARHRPVSYETYRQIVTSRFPEKTYRHLIADHVLPAAEA